MNIVAGIHDVGDNIGRKHITGSSDSDTFTMGVCWLVNGEETDTI